MTAIAELVRETAAVIRLMPEAAMDAVDRWIMRVHHQAWPEVDAPCRHCREVWPCTEYMDAGDRIADRKENQ